MLPLLLLLSLCILPTSSLYFLIGAENRKCFIEEMPANTHAVASYVNADWSPKADETIDIQVYDLQEKSVHQQDADITGRFAWTSTDAGHYKICLSVKTKDASSIQVKNNANRGEASHKYKFHFEVTVGEESRNYAKMMKSNHLTNMEVEVLKLTDRMKDVTRELKYQNKREEEFRNTSESTNTRVMWWSVLQMVVMLVSAGFQSYHLKRFFEAKKLR